MQESSLLADAKYNPRTELWLRRSRLHEEEQQTDYNKSAAEVLFHVMVEKLSMQISDDFPILEQQQILLLSNPPASLRTQRLTGDRVLFYSQYTETERNKADLQLLP